MVTLKLSVHGQYIKLLNKFNKCTVSDTLNYFKCQFTFDSSWEDFNDKSVYFKNVSSGITKPGVLDDDNTCFIPWEVLENTGVIITNVVGIRVEDGEVVQKLPTFPIELFVQVEEGQVNVVPPENYTPSQYEQFIAQVADYAAEAKASEEKIKNMSVGATGLPEGYEPTVTKIESDTGFRLLFGIPKGEHGEPGEPGEPGEAGADGRGIISIDKAGTEDLVDTYTITYSDGTTSTYQVTNGSAGIVKWSDIADKPEYIDDALYLDHWGSDHVYVTTLDESGTVKLPKYEHNHDGRYYLKGEVDTKLSNKVDKVSGKGLSSNDYTTDHKNLVTKLGNRDSTGSYTHVFQRRGTNQGDWDFLTTTDIVVEQGVTLDSELYRKVDKVTGKGLSTNDFTTALKNKLDGIASGAEVNVQADWNQTNVNADDYIKNKPTIPEGVKLYSATGQSTDGAMTQKATTAALNGKANSSHNHNASDINNFSGEVASIVGRTTISSLRTADSSLTLTDDTIQYDLDNVGTGVVALDRDLNDKVDCVRSDRNSVKFANGHYTSYLELFNVPNHGAVSILKAEEEVSTQQTNMAGLTAETDGYVSKATLYANSYDEAKDGARIELYDITDETIIPSSVNVYSTVFRHNDVPVLTEDALGEYLEKSGGVDYSTDLSSGVDTTKNIASISLPPGVWLISARCRFTPTSSGAHVTSVGLTYVSAGDYTQDRRYGSSTYFNQHNFVNVLDLRDKTGNTPVYLTGKSSVAGTWTRSSNTALSLRAVKVPVKDSDTVFTLQ